MSNILAGLRPLCGGHKNKRARAEAKQNMRAKALLCIGIKSPAHYHNAADAAAKLIRISGEVISVDDAATRTGRARAKLLAMYRNGKRTWGELERVVRNAADTRKRAVVRK